MSTVGIGVIGIVVLVVVIGLGFMVLLGVLIPILMNRRRTDSSSETPVEENPQKDADKKEILEMLAKKEISKEEAEKRLAE